MVKEIHNLEVTKFKSH